MIAFLQGVLASKSPERVEVDVNGVGYEVAVSQKTLQALPPAGQTVLLKTYLHVREDIFQLYGFLRDSEKQAFLLLNSVSGIGPRAALNILSVFSPDELYRALVEEDLRTLRTAPGIGQKTAQHMILELRDKVTKLSAEGLSIEETPMGAAGKNISDAIQAMLTLGYSAAESRRAVLTAAQALGAKSTVEEMVKAGLKSASRL